jgi:rhodanese-related sulfurtransferase
MKTISPIELLNLLAGHPDLPVFDVRTPVEFAEYHLPRTQNVPLDDLQPATLNLPKEQPVYLLCRTDRRAAMAAEKFAREGFTPVVVQGGTQAWIAASLPVTRGTGKGVSLERQVRIAAGSLVLLGVLLGWFVHHAFFGLAAFVGAGLVFAGITDFCGMGLLLAKMPWNKKVSQ